MPGFDFGDEIRRVFKDIENRNPDMIAGVRLRRAWQRVVDETVINHTDAVYTVPGSNASDVIIYVNGNIWATELNLQSEMLRMKLNIALRDMDEQEGRRQRRDDMALVDVGDLEQIKRLRFMASKEQYRTKEAILIDTPEQILADQHLDVEPISLTDEELDMLQEQCSQIENVELRQAAFEAAKADLELKKGLNGC